MCGRFYVSKSKKGERYLLFWETLETIEFEKGIPQHTFKIIALIETPGAVLNIQEILHCLSRKIGGSSIWFED
jgi:citrate lyase subunit beta/citryl-CoA lyase